MDDFPGSRLRSLFPPIVILFLALALGVPGFARGQEGDPAPTWRIDDLLLQESAGDFRVSPDGSWAVWVRSGRKGEDGEGVILGASADRPNDPAAGGEAGPAYRGLRVVRGGG